MAWYEIRGSRQELIFFGAGYATREKAAKAAATAKKIYSKMKKRLTIRTGEYSSSPFNSAANNEGI